MRVGVFCVETGIAEQSIDCESIDDPTLLLNQRPGYVMLPCDDISASYYADGEVRSKGVAPSEHHVFSAANGWVLCSERLTYALRKRRKKLLDECDWTQLPDVPEATKLAWHSYRQLLRDISDQPGWPENVIWPSKPY